MIGSDYSTILNATYASTSNLSLIAGQVCVFTGSQWVVATPTNLALYPTSQTVVALTPASIAGVFSALATGIVPPDVASLGAGAQQFVGLTGSGGMARQASIVNAVGLVDATGLINFRGAQEMAAFSGAATAITSLTGGATATGPGAAAATLVLTASAFVTGILAIANGGTGLSSVGANNTVLTSNGTTASWQAPAAAGITALTGDVTASGSGSVAATVAAIQGVVISGTAAANKTLVASGSAAAAWGTIPAAGVTPGTAAQIFVTNAGATAPAWVTVSGDSTLSASGVMANTAINGVTVSGTAAANKALVATSSSAAAWSTVPVAALTAGTSGQILVNSATPTPSWVTMSGDVTISAAGATTVGAISGTTPIAITPVTLQWLSTTATPTLTQASVATASATGAAMTIQAQSATGTTSNGGQITIASGNGTTAVGNLVLALGPTRRAGIIAGSNNNFEVGDGGAGYTAGTGYRGIVLNDTGHQLTGLLTSTGYTVLWSASNFFFAQGGGPTGFGAFPFGIDSSNQVFFQRSATNLSGITNACVAAIADAIGTTPIVSRAFSGSQTANLFTAQSSTPATLFEVGPTGNIGIGSAGSYGGGAGGVAFFANATTAPSSNPSGGLVAYAASGALTVRGSGGAVFTSAPAGSITGGATHQFPGVVGSCATSAGSTTLTNIAGCVLTIASGTSMIIRLRVVGRCTANGSSGYVVGDSYLYDAECLVVNVAGTVTIGTPVALVAAQAVPSGHSYIASSVVGLVNTSGSLQLNITPASTGSAPQIGAVTWQGEMWASIV